MCGIHIGNLKTRNSRNWLRYETFIHLFEFKGFSTWGERETQTSFLCWLLLHRQLSTQPTRGARSAQGRLASPSSESQTSSSQAGTQLPDFFQISKSSAHTSEHDVIHTSWSHFLSGIFILTSLNDILSARAWTPALMLHLTNPFSKRKVLMLYCHLQHHNDTIIKTQEGLLYNNIYLSLYCKVSKRVTQGLRLRGSWRPNRNCNILTPTLMAVTLCLFLFTWCSTGGPEVHSAGCWLSLLHLISNFSGPQLIRAPSPFGLVWLSLPQLHSNRLQLNWLDFCLDWAI